jgi:hypothetical protein
LTVAAVGRLELALELKLLQGTLAVGRNQDNISALAPVTTIRSAPGDKLFTPKTHASATTVPGLDDNGGFINEFHAS